ncbi:hypothetical protein [Halobacillus sp. BBL2006]|uniref:hypothetical protein n=1 Tax=Halobacillus sp. BBL2006 TaxID=1543706 RepID=UPI0005440D3B|nr:hypothetical protein [Halobacillus sp. BBL2006]KHE68785.1 hypothetical protein LD39_13935 [Halobacillus sp. BBL2006]
MEELIRTMSWPIFIAFLIIHTALLLFKKRKAVLFTASIMTGIGAVAIVLGLISFLGLGVYGVLLMLVGLVFYISTKDHMEKG